LRGKYILRGARCFLLLYVSIKYYNLAGIENLGGIVPERPLWLRTCPADAHESSPSYLFEKQNVHERISSDLATLDVIKIVNAILNSPK